MASSSAIALVHLPPPKAKPPWLTPLSYTHLLSHPTLISLLQTCNSMKQLKQIQAQIFTTGVSHDPFAVTSLLEFSALSGDLDYALQIFDRIDSPNVFSWNTMIRAFSSTKSPSRSAQFFAQMLHCGTAPNKYTFPFLLKSFSGESALFSGRTVHSHALKLGLDSDFHIQSSLVHLYSNCGCVDDARKLFDKMPERNVVCWSAMIAGYVQANRFKEALNLFHQFQIERLEPNESILVTMLSACAHLGALEQGKWIHIYIERNKIFMSVNIGTALINLYSKCGVVEFALRVFNNMTRKNVLSWTALITGLAMNGFGTRALDVFKDMLNTSQRPDSVTFIGVLMACSHAGLVDEGHRHFEMMEREYGIVPRVEHYGCLVDGLGRAGFLDEALNLIETMPIEQDIVLWGALLHACCVHKNLELGQTVGRLLIELEPHNDANYVLLSNIYASSKRWKDALEVRRLMKDRGVKKCPGCSVIEVDGVVHEFFVGDKSDPRFGELQPMLDEMGRRLRLVGYVPNTSQVLLDIDEEEKQQALCYHSEKLAIAFGLINTNPPAPIRIVKNLRACVDCHSATKLISKVFNREIIVRDRLRFHHFKDGVCSCLDYW